MVFNVVRRREDLEDLLSDPVYFQAVFHSLSFVKDLYKSQAELGLANESIARACPIHSAFNSSSSFDCRK